VSDAPRAATEQQKELKNPPSTESLATIPAGQALPPPSPVHQRLEDEIRKILADSKWPPDIEKAWLIRALAILRVANGHEVTYRLIMGSQIYLLLAANTPTPPNREREREMYDLAKINFPDIYTNFQFDPWLNWLAAIGFVQIDVAGLIRITPLGQDFLHYLVNNSLTSPKPG
jgi:hypothetical protein